MVPKTPPRSMVGNIRGHAFDGVYRSVICSSFLFGVNGFGLQYRK